MGNAESSNVENSQDELHDSSQLSYGSHQQALPQQYAQTPNRQQQHHQQRRYNQEEEEQSRMQNGGLPRGYYDKKVSARVEDMSNPAGRYPLHAPYPYANADPNAYYATNQAPPANNNYNDNNNGPSQHHAAYGPPQYPTSTTGTRNVPASDKWAFENTATNNSPDRQLPGYPQRYGQYPQQPDRGPKYNNTQDLRQPQQQQNKGKSGGATAYLTSLSSRIPQWTAAGSPKTPQRPSQQQQQQQQSPSTPNSVVSSSTNATRESGQYPYGPSAVSAGTSSKRAPFFSKKPPLNKNDAAPSAGCPNAAFSRTPSSVNVSVMYAVNPDELRSPTPEPLKRQQQHNEQVYTASSAPPTEAMSSMSLQSQQGVASSLKYSHDPQQQQQHQIPIPSQQPLYVGAAADQVVRDESLVSVNDELSIHQSGLMKGFHKADNKNKVQTRKIPKKKQLRNTRSKHRDDSAATSNSFCEGESRKQASLQQPPEQLVKGKKKKPKKKRFTWRKFVPPGTVDPITLESIVALSYPPFAIAAEEPWSVVPIWPTPATTTDGASPQSEAETQERKSRENVNLYDGRALAYYLVSQLSFIDPLNRRDLTRPELINLDNYLQRHNLGKAHVVEAYDNLGMTKSRAGVAGQTAQGRAELLQMEAQSIMEALFSGTHEDQQIRGRSRTRGTDAEAQGRQFNHTDDTTTVAEVNQFCSEFQQLFLSQHPQVPQNQPAIYNATDFSQMQSAHDGIIDYEEGFVIMDDDDNPSLRGRSYREVMPHSSLDTTRGTQSQAAVDAFPSLSEAFASAAPTSPSTTAVIPSTLSSKPPSKAKGPSQSLKTIAMMVQKTNPKELERQRKATQESQRRAQASAFTCMVPDVMPRVQSAPTLGFQPSEAMIERNQRLANALGVVPLTMRPKTIQRDGWARPTETQYVYDDFGNELNWTNYPLLLISQAKENFNFIMKLEKRWIAFLNDDTSPSLSLRPMARPQRKIVHEYSEFWRLQTESFDPEPKRYIHCVKLRDTQAPHPLLSEAVKSSCSLKAPPRSTVTTTSDLQIKSIEPLVLLDDLAPADSHVERAIPLPPQNTSVPQGAIFERDELVAKLSAFVPKGLPLSITATPNFPVNPNSRFSGLDRPRQKLNLAPRTIPQELPSFEGGINKITQSRPQKKVKKKVQKADELDIIAKAFESESDSVASSSDWEVGEAKYGSSSDENELW